MRIVVLGRPDGAHHGGGVRRFLLLGRRVASSGFTDDPAAGKAQQGAVMALRTEAFALPEEAAAQSIRVIVFDQDPVSRHVVGTALSAADGMDVVAALHDVKHLRRAWGSGHVAVVSAPPESALEAAEVLVSSGVRVICLGVGWTAVGVSQMFSANVAACLVKATNITPLVSAVRAVAADCVVLSEELRDLHPATAPASSLTARTAAHPTAANVSAERLLSSLTARELEVLELLAAGWSTAEAAGILSVSKATVKSHVSHSLVKLGVRNRLEAVLLVRHLIDRAGSAVALFTRSQPSSPPAPD